MSNITLRSGNSYEFPITLTTNGVTPFELAGSRFDITAYDPLGAVLLTHELVVDTFGNTTSSDGMAVGPDGSTAGVILHTLTADETAALDGWVRWQLDVLDSEGNTETPVQGAWFVRARDPYRIPGGTTRLDLRRRILDRLGDFMLVHASANGSTDTIIDAIRLIGEPDAYRGRQVLFTAGTPENIGQQRFVSGSSRTSRSLSFDLSLPAATAIGDECEVCNFYGTGYRFEDVNRAINIAIDNAADAALEPAFASVSGTFTRVPGVFAIPDDWVGFGGVQWRDGENYTWQGLERAQNPRGSGWSVDLPNRQVIINGERGYRIEGKEVQIYGWIRPRPLDYDDDTTGINAEWIVAESIAHLSRAAYRRNPTKERLDTMAFDAQDAAIMRTRVSKRTAGMVRL